MTQMAVIALQLIVGLLIGGIAGILWLRSLRWTVGAVVEGRSMFLPLGSQLGRFLMLALLLAVSAKWLGAAGLVAAVGALTISKRQAIASDGGRS